MGFFYLKLKLKNWFKNIKILNGFCSHVIAFDDLINGWQNPSVKRRKQNETKNPMYLMKIPKPKTPQKVKCQPFGRTCLGQNWDKVILIIKNYAVKFLPSVACVADGLVWRAREVKIRKPRGGLKHLARVFFHSRAPIQISLRTRASFYSSWPRQVRRTNWALLYANIRVIVKLSRTGSERHIVRNILRHFKGLHVLPKPIKSVQSQHLRPLLVRLVKGSQTNTR